MNYDNYYKNGGMTKEESVSAIALRIGARKEAVAKFVEQNNIDTNKLNSDLKSGEVYFMDVITAIVGMPNNKYEKEIVKKYGSKMAMGGKTQGYDDREDERLGMKYGKMSGKDFVGSHEMREHSRRDDARFEERMEKGGKLYTTQMNVGRAKYVINYHDGSKTHKDGSPFYDIDIFSNRKDFDKAVKKLESEGYKYRYAVGGMMADGGKVSYDIEYRDEEGDTYEASFDTLEDAKEEIRKIREEGGRITETWKYVDGKFSGRFKHGGMMADGGRIKVGTFDEAQLKKGEDKIAVQKLQKESGLNYVDSKIIKKGGKMYLDVYLIPNEEYYKSSKFGNGGMMADGGEVYYVRDFYPNYDEDKIASILKSIGAKKVRKAKLYGYSNQPDVVVFEGDKNEAQEILEKEFPDNYISIYEKDWGRKMADGGETERDKNGMLYALQEHVSSGEIANITNTSKYVDIDSIRSKAIQYYMQNGDKPYSYAELESVLKKFDHTKMANGGKLEAGVYRIGKPKRISDNLYEQKIVEIFDNGDIATASDYGRKLGDFKSQMYPIINQEQFEEQYRYAQGGAIEDQYVGRTAQDIWNSLSELQRQHFIGDHAIEIEMLSDKNYDDSKNEFPKEMTREFVKKAYRSDWEGLDEVVQNRFANHVRKGEYAKGGIIKVGDKVRSKIFSGVEGEVVSKKGDMLFIVRNNALPNGDMQHDVLRINEVEKLAKGGKTDDIDYSKQTTDDFTLGEIVWDVDNKRYGTVIGIYDDDGYASSKFELRLDSDGVQPTENLRKVGDKGDKGTKKQLDEAITQYARLVKLYGKDNDYPKQIKPDDSKDDDKPKNKWEYTDKDEIEYVVVKDKSGKELKFDGKYVISGVHDLLEKGGKLTEIGKYFSKNDVVSVVVNGKNILDKNTVSGVWIKKDAKPMAEDVADIKIGKTTLKKGVNGWVAKTMVDNFKGFDWDITTIKNSRGDLTTTAQGGKSEDKGGYKMFTFMVFQDPAIRLKSSRPARVTDKVVSAQHEEAMKDFKERKEEIAEMVDEIQAKKKSNDGAKITFNKLADGGYVVSKADEDGYVYILDADGKKVSDSKIPSDIGYGKVKNKFVVKKAKYDTELGKNDANQIVERMNSKYAKGGAIGFDALAKKVAKNYEGDKVKKEFQDEYGKTYDKQEAEEVGKKVAGKVYRQQQAKGKMAKGGKTNNRSENKMTQISRKASEIRKADESWRDAFNRAKAMIG